MSFSCDKCHKCYSTKGNLDRHIKTSKVCGNQNKIQKKFACLNCNSTFTRKDSLKVHIGSTACKNKLLQQKKKLILEMKACSDNIDALLENDTCDIELKERRDNMAKKLDMLKEKYKDSGLQKVFTLHPQLKAQLEALNIPLEKEEKTQPTNITAVNSNVNSNNTTINNNTINVSNFDEEKVIARIKSFIEPCIFGAIKKGILGGVINITTKPHVSFSDRKVVSYKLEDQIISIPLEEFIHKNLKLMEGPLNIVYKDIDEEHQYYEQVEKGAVDYDSMLKDKNHPSFVLTCEKYLDNKASKELVN